MREFLLRRLRRAPVIEQLWDEYERMRAARDGAIAEREEVRSELVAALAMRDVALAERDEALAQRGPAPDRQGEYSTSEYLLWAYRLLLGREPEDPRLLQTSPTSRREIVERFTRSEEFVAKHYSAIQSAASDRPVSIFLGDRVLTYTHRGNPIYIVPSDLDLTPAGGVTCQSASKLPAYARFVADSLLEQAEFELAVPLCRPDPLATRTTGDTVADPPSRNKRATRAPRRSRPSAKRAPPAASSEVFGRCRREWDRGFESGLLQR
jgi:hypothetical protein